MGSLQRLLLFLLLDEDNPLGRYIPIWHVVHRRFGIEYEPFLARKKQNVFDKERKIKYAFERLVVKGFVLPMWASLTGFSLFSLDGSVCDRCILTEKGRLFAERLKYQELVLKEEVAVVKRIFDMVYVLNEGFVTFECVLEFLWLDSFHGFVNRVEFDRYWNGTKLGKVLRLCGVSRSRVSRLDGRMRYYVKSVNVV